MSTRQLSDEDKRAFEVWLDALGEELERREALERVNLEREEAEAREAALEAEAAEKAAYERGERQGGW